MGGESNTRRKERWSGGKCSLRDALRTISRRKKMEGLNMTEILDKH